MAKVAWSAGIDHVSGALSKPSKNGHHSCKKMLLGTHRVAETTNPNCTRLYVKKSDAYTRTTPVLASERAARLRFATVSRAVQARMQDLSRVSVDQANYIAQKDQPNGKKSMKKYLWSLELATYDAAHE